MPPPALALSGLSKAFNDLQAVDALSLEVQRGEIYGFLGPNGAGKTTTIKMILGLTYPDAGEVRIDGKALTQEPHAIKRTVGFLPERVAFYPNLTALQNLEFFARLKGDARTDLADLLESVGLEEFARKKVNTFSKGMVQLLGVAQAMIGRPSLLILDEPTVGLDPAWTRSVKDRVQEANEGGATVFFSSHILGEVQELAHRVAILHRGRLLAQDTVDNLSDRLELKPRLRVRTGGDPTAASAALQGVEGVAEVRVEKGEVVVRCTHDAKSRVLSHLERSGVAVVDFRTEEPSLEEVFLRLTREEGGGVR